MAKPNNFTVKQVHWHHCDWYSCVMFNSICGCLPRMDLRWWWTSRSGPMMRCTWACWRVWRRSRRPWGMSSSRTSSPCGTQNSWSRRAESDTCSCLTCVSSSRKRWRTAMGRPNISTSSGSWWVVQSCSSYSSLLETSTGNTVTEYKGGMGHFHLVMYYFRSKQ